MLDLIRRYGLDRWGPLTFALLLVVAVVTVTVAVLIVVTRPSVDEVIKAGQAIGLAAVALGAAIAGHGHLQGARELADATREAAAVTAEAVVADPAAPPDPVGPLVSDADEVAGVPSPESAVTPDVVAEHHGPEDPAA